ncbi:little elongation complex subunit 2 isoform X1 [Anguilla anguilla]|uniref:little elongation complex subunit 2 isoform X1 n=1 Tax=Anguilla anguilla TaxID=7936 RepID=UPI0015B13A4E|nr:little elongation complex subunit 2 isoform X1 [Anguilla anguilla]
MELKWEDLHYGGTVGFPRDLYDKYSLAPTMKELCAIAQIRSPVKAEVKPEPKVENVHNKPDCNPSVELEKTTTHAKQVLPEPKVPFPRLSSMTFKEQVLYMRWLKQQLSLDTIPDVNFSQLQERVNNETSEFMKYLQDVAKIFADEYNYMSKGAARYSEECLRASLEMVKNYPQLYLIHEMTSITGGKFNPGLSLYLEKQLLTLGNVMMVALPSKKLPKNVQLAEDFEPVSSETPPVKKSSWMHTSISNDLNAEKLYARYEPHVCMTSQAFHRLLNNHGPEYSEQWEIPVWVKMTTGKDPKKEVYIDSPLVETEMTVREKIRLFHEESIKLALRRPFPKNVLELLLDRSTSDSTVALPQGERPRVEESQRSVISFANDSIDSDVDLTDLETFGESTAKSLKEPNPSGSAVKSALAAVKSPPQEGPLPRKRLKGEPPVECPSDRSASGDSDEERLVIDAPPSPRSSSSETARPKPPSTSATKEPAPPPDSALHAPSSRSSDGVPDPLNPPASDTPRSPSPEPSGRAGSSDASPAAGEKAKRAGRRAAPRAPQDCDQLGQILRMQSALLKPSPSPAQDPVPSPPRGATPGSSAHPAQGHSQSLVKTCVSSYLEANQGPVQGASVCSASAAPSPDNNQTTAERKKLLSEELMLSEEDKLDYACPEEGNLLYRLYSLKDVLLMVRSSVPLARWKMNENVSEVLPVHFLPKLQYQLCYGIERLTKSEVCQLWAERLLHSSTVSYIGHIDPLTSMLFKTEELSPEKMAKASCGFVPARPLNILHHLIKKVSGLQEGRYLLCHKAGESFVTILKACEGTSTTRATYDLHQAHAHLPQAPPHAPIPWVPLDPTHMLPYHIKYNRVPCTFPPRPAFQANRTRPVVTRTKRAKVVGVGRAHVRGPD